MKMFFSVFCLCMISFLNAETTSPANTHLLREAIIPELILNRATLSEAIDLLRDSTKKEDLQVNFLVTPEAAAMTTVVSLDLRGVNGLDAFSTILSITKTRAEIRRNIIWILPNP